MAKSVDDLIEFLLEEIALSGSRGTSINELCNYVRSFYNGNDGSQSGTSTLLLAVSVDKALLSKVWVWLGRHPDVSIGKGKKYNKISLPEVELEFPGCLDQISSGPESAIEVNDKSGPVEEAPPEQTTQESNNAEQSSRSKQGPHVTVNYERMYRAICGHPPDSSKLVPLEFALLTHIAASRSIGILQGPLTRASGQDKRSVPKRTDVLHRKGYIIKEPVYAHGTKTSRLTLRKLAATTTNKESVLSSATGGESQQKSTVRGVVRRIFEMLSTQNLIPQTDLSERLEMSSTGKLAILIKVIRRLERVKLVKRVKTAFGPSATVEDLKQCVQLVQIPSPSSLEEFDTDELALRHSFAELASIMGMEEPLELSKSTASETKEMDFDSAASPPLALAQWNPARLMPNMLRDAVQVSSPKGLTNVGARRATTGLFIRRAAEASLFRLSCRSLLAQPAHLKHLAVVRAYITSNGVAQFFHYSWDTFRELATRNTIDITHIPGAKKALANMMCADDAQSRGAASSAVDLNGFPREPPSLQIMQGKIELASIIEKMRIEDIPPRHGEPVIVETEPGKFSLVPQTAAIRTSNRAKTLRATPKPATPKRAIPKQTSQTDQGELSEQEIILGRPRKYVRGTEKFWRKQFSQAIIYASAARGIHLTQAPKKGIMKHPDGLALYGRRPQDFDETLLEAIDAHLPIPAEPHDINEQWVQATKSVLKRHSDGVYLTPKGLLGDSKKQLSQILVFKSSKLKDVKLIDRRPAYPVRFLSSSASHTFAYFGFDHILSGARHLKSIHATKRTATPTRKTLKNTKQRLGPRKGLFEDKEEALSNTIPQPSLSPGATNKESLAPQEGPAFEDGRLSLSSLRPSPPPGKPSSEILGPQKGVFFETDRISASSPQVSLSPRTLHKDFSRDYGETTNDETQIVQFQPQVSKKRRGRKSKALAVESQQVDQASTLLQQTSPPAIPIAITTPTLSRSYRKRKRDDQFSPPSQQVSPFPTVPDTTTPPARSRPSRKRQLTEKARQNAETATGDTGILIPTELQTLPTEHVPPVIESVESHPTQEKATPVPDLGLLPAPANLASSDSGDEQVQAPVSTTASDAVLENQSIVDFLAQWNISASGSRIANRDLQTTGDEAQDSLPTVTSPPVPLMVASSNIASENAVAASMLLESNVNFSGLSENPDVIVQEQSSFEVQNTERSLNNIAEVLDSSASEPELLPTRRSVQRKRRRVQTPDMDDPDFIDDERSPGKRAKEGGQKYTAGANSLCKKLVLHLMSITKGAAPNDAFTLRRLAVPRWKEEGYGESTLLKAIKSTVKRLCASGKLKQTSFAFRGKAGVMVRRSILYLPNVSADSDLVENVRQSIIAVEPADYIPPEWTEEASLLPLFIAMPRVSEIAGPSTRKRRLSTPESDALPDRSPETNSARFPSLSPVRETPPGAATGFLTLKVANLGALPLVHLENWQNELGRVRERAEAAKFAQRRERSSRSQGLHSKDRPLMWANKLVQDFPTSLQDIILVTPAHNLYVSTEDVDRNWQRFAKEIEAVEAWEQNHNSAAQNFRTSYAFIDHSLPTMLFHDIMGYSKVEFASLVHFDENGEQREIPFPPESPLPDAVLALAERDEEQTAKIAVGIRETLTAPPVLSDHEDTQPGRRKRKRKAKEDDVDFTPPTKRRKARATIRQPKIKAKTKTNSVISTIGHKRFIRGIQYLRDLPAQQVRHLAVSVVVVRTLLGGLDGFIDWPVVMTLFPNELESTIQGRWKTLSNKYRGDIRGLTESLQARYLEALEADQVPCVNFSDIKATDWQGIVDWAIDNLDRFDVEGVEELPADKASLIDDHEFSFVELRNYPSLLTYANNITTQMKENTFSAAIFGSVAPISQDSTQLDMNLQFKPRYEDENLDPDFRLTRSWVFASILTTDPGFDPDFVRSKLATLGSTENETNDLLHQALKVLQDEKLIQKGSTHQKSIMSLGRGLWEPAKKFYERFDERRMINATMLRQAMTFKLSVLDAAFERGDSISIPKETIIDDGTMVTILNLMSNGQIIPKLGGDIPRTRYGLDWEQVAYSSRHMEKSAVEFTTHLTPTARYIPGDTTQSGRNAPIPRGEADLPMGHIPPWLDIHTRFQPKLWEMFVAGTLGLVVQLPGIGAREISRTLGFAMDEGEVALLMGWCVEAGFAMLDSASGGYQTTEVWWACISCGDWEWVMTPAGHDIT
ncbi:hypothetical protein LTR84_005529 [Exophiala bonariae]|uniref:B-block binding subunit of TFIIIC domain-containing protein n=1 Tax=Exophiala bonariae TaxID=1690606 RepID=A0AAV9N6Z0_9EURO|nr:hypothetical protein LTR84_005529 [Exophiala bonariae]